MTDIDNDEALLEFFGDEEEEYNLGNEDEDALLADDADSVSVRSVRRDSVERTTDDVADVDEAGDVLRISDYEEELCEEPDNSDGVTTTTHNVKSGDDDDGEETEKRQSAKFRLEREGPTPKSDKIPETLDQVITKPAIRTSDNRGRNQNNRRSYGNNRFVKTNNDLKTVHINPHFRGQVNLAPHESRINWDARQRLNNQRSMTQQTPRNHDIPPLFPNNRVWPQVNQEAPPTQWQADHVQPAIHNYAPPTQNFAAPPPPQLHPSAQWNQYPMQNVNYNQMPPQQWPPNQQPAYMGGVNQYAPPPYCTPTNPMVNYAQPVYNAPMNEMMAINNYQQPPPTQPPMTMMMMPTPVDTYDHHHHQQQQLPPATLLYPQNQPMASNGTIALANFHHNIGNKMNNSYRKRVEPLQRRKRYFEKNNNLQEVRTVDTTQPDTTSNIEIIPQETTEHDAEDDETRAYRQQIEKQKQLREKILREKEARRLQAAKHNAATPTSSLPGGTLQAIVKTTLLTPTPAKLTVEPTSTFLANRTVLERDASLTETRVVLVSNLANATTELKLRKMSQGIGTIQKFQMSPKERQATITFNSVASAHAFFKKYQRTMLDLSMIKVTLLRPNAINTSTEETNQ